MATSNVAGGSKPAAGKLGMKGHAQVAQLKGSFTTKSSGKMHTGNGVTLGTTHGHDQVAHRHSSSAGTIQNGGKAC